MNNEFLLEDYNGSWKSLKFNGIDLGIIEILNDGFLVTGKRKPVETLKEAAKQILDKRMNACMAEHEKHRKLLGKILLT